MTGRGGSGGRGAGQKSRPSARSDSTRKSGSSAPEAPALSAGVVPEPLLPPSYVIWVFGICSRTLPNWERDGVLVPIRIKRRLYYRAADVRKLWEEGRR